MKLAFYLLIFFSLFTFSDESLSLTNYQIKNICKKQKSQSTCIKNLKEKKSTLQKGSKIEILIIPYKR